MLGTAPRKERATSNAHSGFGFTFLELLTVTLVLGVLAAIVVSKVGSAAGQSVTATCVASSRTVNDATAIFRQEHAFVTQITRSELTVGPGRTLQSWPSGSSYTISLAGDSNDLVGAASADTPSVTIEANDVVVTVGTRPFDATQDPLGACKLA